MVMRGAVVAMVRGGRLTSEAEEPPSVLLPK